MSLPTFFAHGALHAQGSMFGPVGSAVSQATNIIAPVEIPDIGTLMDLAARGWITEGAMSAFARNHGITIDPSRSVAFNQSPGYSDRRLQMWNAAFYARQELPSAHELFVLANRGVVSDDELESGLHRLGFHSGSVRKDFQNLRYEVPGPSDLVRFAVRHVFEPDLVYQLDYAAERDKGPYLLDIFHQAAGINYPIFTGPLASTVKMVTGRDPSEFVQLYAAAGLPEPTWADAYWWSHWVLPSPSQGYEMLFQLNPDRNHAFDPPGTSDENFSLESLDLLLRANDYPPFYRRKLAAIAYRTPGIRFMRELLRTGVFGNAELKDLLTRQGYSPGFTDALVRMLAKSDRDARRAKIESQAHGQLARYYEIGIIDAGTYQQYLTQHGMLPDDAAQTVVLAEVDRSAKRAQRVILYVKSSYIKGAIDRLQASAMLAQAGVLDPQKSDYIEEWTVQIKAKHREISADKAIKLACKGLITLDDLNTRLTNLEYSQDDVRVLGLEAVQCAQERAAMLAAKAARAERQRQNDLIAAQRRAAQQIKAARQALSSHGTPAQLRKWFCEGHVSRTEVQQRLGFLGWPDVDIERLIADCKSGSGGSGGATPGGSVGPSGGP